MGKFDDISLQPQDFGSTASTHTILTGPKLDELFPTDKEREDFKKVLAAVDAASQSNAAQSQFIDSISGLGGVVLKLLKVVVPI